MADLRITNPRDLCPANHWVNSDPRMHGEPHIYLGMKLPEAPGARYVLAQMIGYVRHTTERNKIIGTELLRELRELGWKRGDYPEGVPQGVFL